MDVCGQGLCTAEASGQGSFKCNPSHEAKVAHYTFDVSVCTYVLFGPSPFFHFSSSSGSTYLHWSPLVNHHHIVPGPSLLRYCHRNLATICQHVSLGLLCMQLRWGQWTMAGYTKKTILINGRYPGPLINVTEGDHVVVRVNNHLTQPVSVHW